MFRTFCFHYIYFLIPISPNEWKSLTKDRGVVDLRTQQLTSRWFTESLLCLSFKQGVFFFWFREEYKSTQIPQKELFWQGPGLPPTNASSSLLPSTIHLWGVAYSPSPTPTQNRNWTGVLRRRTDTQTQTRTHRPLLLQWKHGIAFVLTPKLVRRHS